MKLLMISGDRSLASGRQGAFWQTLDGLRTHFKQIDILCPPSAGDVRQIFPNVIIHPSPWPLLFQPWWIASMGRRLVREGGHQVITVHEYPPFFNGLGARAVASATSVPVCSEIHHLVGEPRAADWKESLLRPLNRLIPFVTSFAVSVRVVNGGVRDRLIQLGVPAEKIAVVSSLYLHLDTLKLAATTPTYDLVFCGRLVPNKGLLTVITALRELPGATLLVIGDGPEKARAVAHTERLGLSARVTFVGWLPTPDDLANALRSARIFVLNSLSEGGPRVLLEAMACGLPVVTTRVGIAPDVVHDGQNGFFHDGSAVSLAAALRKILGDPAQARALGQAGRREAERFEYSAGIAAYASFLQSLAR